MNGSGLIMKIYRVFWALKKATNCLSHFPKCPCVIIVPKEWTVESKSNSKDVKLLIRRI